MSILWLVKYYAVGPFLDMFPAGDIWSVVIESPNKSIQCKFLKSFFSGNINEKSLK